jgi:20S proteasome alpha/beta subunit
MVSNILGKEILSDFSTLQSIEEHNGGSVVAMAGKECVAIASDLRLGNGSVGLSTNFQRVRW